MMKKISRVVLISSLITLLPLSSFALRAGDYIALEAKATPSSLTGSESSSHEEYEFEGANTTDTNIGESSTELLGYGETKYPVSVVGAGEVIDISPSGYPDLFQFEQELQVQSGEIYQLFQKYRNENFTPAQRDQFSSDWQNVLDGYASVISGLDESIDLNQAKSRLSGETVKNVLNQVPELSTVGGTTIHTDANTDPFAEGSGKDLFALMGDIGRQNWAQAQKAAAEIKTLMSGRSYADTQIVARPDLLNSGYNYDGNVLTFEIMSRGSMSYSGGESLKTQYVTDEDGNNAALPSLTTEEARQNGADVTGKAFETIQIEYTPENAAKLRAMQEKLKNLDNGDNWFSLNYRTVLRTFELYFPEYDTSSIWSEFERVAQEKDSITDTAKGTDLVNISLKSPNTLGLITDSDISSTTATSFDAAIFLVMGEDSMGTRGDSASQADRNRLMNQFLSDYILSAGIECLSESELTSRYPHDAYSPNEDIYEVDEKFTGTLGTIHRLFAGDFPAYNKLTGSYENITHASESNYDYICFCAGTNGWIRLKDGSGQVRFIRSTDFLSAANSAAADHDYGSDLISDCYMVCAGENNNKGHSLEIRMDSSQLSDHIFRKLTIDDLKRLVGDHEISLEDLQKLLTGEYDFNIQSGDLADYFDNDLEKAKDWWNDIIREIMRDFTDGPSLPDGTDGAEGQSGSEDEDITGLDTAPHFSMEDFIRWLIDQGYITRPEGEDPSDQQLIQWMTDYFPEYLSTYSGEVIFDVSRVITKQIRNTTSRSTSRFQNVGYPEQGGTHRWISVTNGFPSASYYGGAQSGVTLAAGTTKVSATERLRQVFEDALTYDYTEEWILEPFGFVIFKKSVNGQLAGVDGQQHDVNTVYFSTTLGPITEYSAGEWSFTTDEDEYGQDLTSGGSGLISLGVITSFSQKSGYWINGIPYGAFSVSQLSVSPVDSSYSFRIQ